MLILGGTGEGFSLAQRLRNDPRFVATYSLAGVTRTPALPGIMHRIGGFGGAAGLADWLEREGIAALVDATHPYAATISRNAGQAAASAAIPLLRIARPPWTSRPGDRWTKAEDTGHAARMLLADAPRTVLLTLGAKDLVPFRQAPQHRYVIRCIDPPDADRTPPAVLLLDRGPFRLQDERALLARHCIDILVTKNSGGDATAPKLQAAREAGIPVVMIRRPEAAPAGSEVPDAAAAWDWIERLHQAAPAPRGA